MHKLKVHLNNHIFLNYNSHVEQYPNYMNFLRNILRDIARTYQRICYISRHRLLYQTVSL